MILQPSLTVLISLLIFTTALAETPRWVSLSRLLTLDSENLPRSTVISRLRGLDGLADKVRQGLQNKAYRSYALDIISALKMTDFTSDLQESLVKDPDGYNVLTLNTLLDKKSFSPIAMAYRKHIEDDLASLSPGALMAMVDSMARWGTPMKKDTVESLLGHSYSEVRLSLIHI